MDRKFPINANYQLTIGLSIVGTASLGSRLDSPTVFGAAVVVVKLAKVTAIASSQPNVGRLACRFHGAAWPRKPMRRGTCSRNDLFFCGSKQDHIQGFWNSTLNGLGSTVEAFQEPEPNPDELHFQVWLRRSSSFILQSSLAAQKSGGSLAGYYETRKAFHTKLGKDW